MPQCDYIITDCGTHNTCAPALQCSANLALVPRYHVVACILATGQGTGVICQNGGDPLYSPLRILGFLCEFF